MALPYLACFRDFCLQCGLQQVLRCIEVWPMFGPKISLVALSLRLGSMPCCRWGVMYKNGLRATRSLKLKVSTFNFTAIVSFHIKCAGVESNHVPAPILYDCTAHTSKQPFCHQVSLTTHFKPIQFQWCQKRSSMAVYCGFIRHSRKRNVSVSRRQ